MQDDQINKSVDDLMGQDVGADSTSVQTATPGLSLGSNPSLPEPPTNTPLPQLPSDDSADQNDSQSETELDQPVETSDNDEGSVAPELEDSETDSEPTETEDVSSTNPTSELDQIKQDALAQLSPIVDELDQPAEEKYRTLMMMIQASDDQSLIKSAYDAANRIDDKKVRAEALLAIVNEINYFANRSDNKES